MQPRKVGRPARDACKRGHLWPARYKNGTCIECHKARAYTANQKASNKECKRLYYINNPKQAMLNAARERAKLRGYPCTITIADIVIPEFCPLLGMRLARSTNGCVLPSSPSLDKIKPELGYIPGNVWVISHRANALKNNATLEELRMLVERLSHVLP